MTYEEMVEALKVEARDGEWVPGLEGECPIYVRLAHRLMLERDFMESRARNVARQLWRRTYQDFNVIEPGVYDTLTADNPWLDEADE